MVRINAGALEMVTELIFSYHINKSTDDQFSCILNIIFNNVKLFIDRDKIIFSNDLVYK